MMTIYKNILNRIKLLNRLYFLSTYSKITANTVAVGNTIDCNINGQQLKVILKSGRVYIDEYVFDDINNAIDYILDLVCGGLNV